MKKIIKFLTAFCIFLSIIFVIAYLFALLTESAGNDFAKDLRILLNIIYPLATVYLCIYIFKHIKGSIPLIKLMNKVSMFIIIFGLTEMLISWTDQFIETQRVNSIFTSFHSVIFLLLGISLKLAIELKKEGAEGLLQ